MNKSDGRRHSNIKRFYFIFILYLSDLSQARAKYHRYLSVAQTQLIEIFILIHLLTVKLFCTNVELNWKKSQQKCSYRIPNNFYYAFIAIETGTYLKHNCKSSSKYTFSMLKIQNRFELFFFAEILNPKFSNKIFA